MDEPSRHFGLDAALSVVTGRLLARDGFAGVYALLRFMTGQDLVSPQLPAAAEVCAAELIVQHPFLGEIALPEDLDDADRFAWLLAQELRFGATLEVDPSREWVREDPIEALCDEFGAENIYVHRVDKT
ncbi:MAG: DUF7736 domain-containing protein [Sporichthyaceae bacterium]